VARRELAPGATVYVMPAPRFKTIHLLLAFRQVLGRSAVTKGALLPRVLRRGTRRWPDRRTLAGHLEDLFGASFGTSSSKMGDHQVIEATFSSAAPDALGRSGWRTAGSGPAGRAVPIHGASLLAMAFSDPAPPGPEGASLTTGGLRADYVREEKDGLRRDIEAVSDDRMSYAHYRCVSEMCRGEPAALHSLGYSADLHDIGPPELDGFRLGLLEAAPAAAYLVGPVDDVTADQVAEVLAREIPALASDRPRAIPPSAPHRRPGDEREVVEHADVEQARLVVGLHTGVVLGDEQFAAQVVYNGLLGGFIHSRLFRRIREEAGLAYYAWSRVMPAKGLILISCGIEAGNYRLALDLIRGELASLGAGDFTGDEFGATRNSVLALAKARLDSASSLVYGHLEALATGLELDEISPWRELERVTEDAVREFASRPVIDTVYLLAREPKTGAESAPSGRETWPADQGSEDPLGE